MDRLSIYLSLAVGAVTTGVLVIAVLVMGWYSWLVIGSAAAIGFLTAWPVSYVISRRIKRLDQGFDHRKAKPHLVPDPTAPEV